MTATELVIYELVTTIMTRRVIGACFTIHRRAKKDKGGIVIQVFLGEADMEAIEIVLPVVEEMTILKKGSCKLNGLAAMKLDLAFKVSSTQNLKILSKVFHTADMSMIARFGFYHSKKNRQ